MIKTSDKTPLEKFYDKYFYFSYSSLNKLLYSTQMFYKWYILRERSDEIESHLVEGKVIHCLLLERQKFDDQFIVTLENVPGVNNKKLVEHVVKEWKKEGEPDKKYEDYSDIMLEWLQNANLHQALKDDKDLTKSGAKTGDQKRLEKVMTPRSSNYFNHLKNSKDKEVIDQATFDRCEEAVNIILMNSAVKNLLRIGQSSFELLEIYNERPLQCAVKGLPFGLQGILDNYVIDHSTKKVYINDLKTTSKTLREFKDSVEYYKYWMQAAIYERLVKANHPEVVGYEFIMHFIVIDKYNQVYPFLVSVESMLDWHIQLDEILKIAKYHYENKDYELPYEFAMNQVTL